MRHRSWRVSAILLMAVGVVLSLVFVSSGFAARRVVLFEESTSTTCPPCAVANPIIEQFLDDYSVLQVVSVKWHVWWPSPGNDPFYLHNPTPSQNRISYYSINAAPDLICDGANGPVPGSYSSMQTWAENRLAILSPIALSATGAINGSNYDVTINLNVETVPPAGDYRMYVVLEEHHRSYTGPNGEPEHYDIFRHLNGASNQGEVINLSATGQQNFNRSIAFDATELPAELQAVVWVQNHTTREVLNAATTYPAPQYYLRVPVAGGGVVNAANQVAVINRSVTNLGQNDVYNIAVSALTGNLPAGWTFQYTTSQGTFTGPSSLPMNSGATENISVEIDSHGNAGGGLVELTFTSQGDPSMSRTLRFSKLSGPAVIVYDDDGGSPYETYLTSVLQAQNISWGLWDDVWGKLTGAQLQTAQAVFWGTGLSYPTIDAQDRSALTTFLNGGGKGFFNGQEIGWELNTGGSGNFDPTWYQNNLHATFLTDAAGYSLTGVAGDPIGDGLSYTLDFNNQPYPDGVSPLGTGSAASASYNQTWKGIVRWDGGSSKVVYMSHGIEGITSPSIRDTIVQRVINWFGVSTGVPNPEGAPAIMALSPNFPNPFTPSTSIPYSLRQEGQVRLTIYDVEGRLVRELVRGNRPAGRQVAVWDGRDMAGRTLGSGIYYYRLETPGFEATRSMVLVK